MPQQKPDPPVFSVMPRDAFDLVLLLSHLHAACLLPPLRYGQGVDVPGYFGLAAPQGDCTLSHCPNSTFSR